MKSAIVTGSTGLIGRWVVAELLKHHIKVFAIVRDRNKADKIFRFHKNLHIVNYDLGSNRSLSQLIQEEIDVFYHFAWEGVSGVGAGDFDIQLSNMEQTLKLTGFLSELKVKKFIGAGSLHEAECLAEMQKEEISDNRGIMYKSSKLATHYMTKVEVCRQGIEFYWPIITNTFGIGEQTPRLINTTIRKLINGESPKFTSAVQLYDFIYVTDVARAFWLIGEKGISCKNYILGSGNCRPLREFLECIGRIVNPKVPLLFGEAPFHGIMLPPEYFDSTSLQKDTGFQCEISFEKSIQYMKEWIAAGEKDVQI